MAAVFAFTVLVYVSNLSDVPPHVLHDAQVLAQVIFRDAGIDVAWVDAPPDGSAHVTVRLIIVRRGDGTLRNRFDPVLGVATRTEEGTGTAWVFSELVAAQADRHAVPLARLLACTIAHELGHVLQQSPGHADHGLMRSAWGSAEYRKAALGRLAFTPADLGGR